MALKDQRGEPVSTTNAKALQHFEGALTLLNGFFADPLATIDQALAEDPDFVMGHCFRAGLMMISTEKGAEPALRAGVEAVERSGKANARERGHIAALRAWLSGDFQGAADLYATLLIEHPRDLLALQLAHQCDFFLGQSMMLRDRIARVLPFWDDSVPGYSYVLGMHAFGLEEMNDYRRAEETGRRALDLEPRDPWAVHAVAHVMEMEGRLSDGIDWLTGRRNDWSVDNMFAYHNWWHLGLYHLDLGDTARVLEVYDSGIRPNPSTVALEMVDASAMLWRLHLRGIDVGNRWGELADKWAAVAEDAYYGFNDAHAMMAFVADGRNADAARLLSALTRRAGEAGTNAMMTRDVALPMSRAIHAFGEERYGDAVDLLLAVRPIAQRFGGSHAQRDIVHLTLIEAALRDGQSGLARALAAERTALKPASPFNWSLTARSLAASGDARGAALAQNRARMLAA